MGLGEGRELVEHDFPQLAAMQVERAPCGERRVRVPGEAIHEDDDLAPVDARAERYGVLAEAVHELEADPDRARGERSDRDRLSELHVRVTLEGARGALPESLVEALRDDVAV